MKILVVLLITFSMNYSFAQYSEKQIRDASRQAIDEEIKNANLNGEREKVLRELLNKTLLNQKAISNFKNYFNDDKYKDKNIAFEFGFRHAMLEREKSMKFLSNKDLYEHMKTNIDILSKMNDFECSQYIKRKNTEESGKGRSLYSIAGTLDIEKFKKYIGLFSKAYDNMTYEKNESQSLSNTELVKVKNEYRQILITFLEENKDINNFLKSRQSFNDINDSEVCRIGKSLIDLLVKGDIDPAGMRINAYLNGILN